MPKFNKDNIDNAKNNKPVVYTLKKNKKPIYVGSAKKGNVQKRLNDHRRKIPATDFSIRQYNSIKDARIAEEEKIEREKPKHNDQHKK